MEISVEIKNILKFLPEKPLLRVDEVASFFDVAQRTIYRWYEIEKLKGCNPNGMLRIYRQSVIELVIASDGLKAEEPEEISDRTKQFSGRKNEKKRGWVKGW